MPIFEAKVSCSSTRIVKTRARSKAHAIKKIEDHQYDFIDEFNEIEDINYESVIKIEKKT